MRTLRGEQIDSMKGHWWPPHKMPVWWFFLSGFLVSLVLLAVIALITIGIM